LTATSACTEEHAIQLNTNIAAEVSGCDNDSSFDLNLRLGLIQDLNQLSDRIEIFTNVCDDNRIAASVRFDRAAARETALNDRKEAFAAAALAAA
jgi:hypothetical protein